MDALRRVASNTVEKRLLNPEGRPAFQLIFYAVSKKGEYAGVCLHEKVNGQAEAFAVCTEKGPEILPCEPLFEGNLSE
jgi:N4-(beta-N-acetylglucosaminyl)-L-asparaginase